MPPSSSHSHLPHHPRPDTAFFLEHLALESARFRETLADAPKGARVPSCPDWDADDLLWHLGDVQWFWGEIAERGLTTGERAQALGDSRPARPTERHGLLDHFDRSSARLHRVLSDLPPETELWMWADDHSAAYIARRQAHEAMVHRLDAELTAGVERSPFDPALAADGVDEALTIMRGHEDDPDEPGIRSAPLAPPVVISAVDTMHSWTVTPLRVFGTDNDGDELDVTAFGVEQGARGGTTDICGTAAELDCWLWNRPAVGALTRRGDEAALAAVDRVIDDSLD